MDMDVATDASPDAGGTWAPITAAARTLGVSRDSLRKRVARGSVRAEKGPDGVWHVWIPGTDAGRTPGTNGRVASSDGGPAATADTSPDATLDALRLELEHARALLAETRRRADLAERQLDAERQASAELRRLLAGTLQVAQLPPASTKTVDGISGFPEPTPSPPARPSLTDRPRRPWWRRWLGWAT